jgi:translation initiation factor IF-2
LAAFGLPDKEKQNVILKADVAGSYEAIRVAIEQLATDEVEVRLLHGGVGPVTQSDVDLAVASDAAILVFNTSIDSKAKRTIDQSNAQVFKYSVIYELIDGVRELMSGLLSPERVEEYLGRAEVRAVFHIQKVGSVAGCMVVDGKMVRNMFAKVMRGGEAIYTGKLTTLKRVKDDAREVVSGMECGLTVEGYKDIQVGDLVEVYEVTDVRRTIE